MFCPLDLFRLKELTGASVINNLAGYFCLETRQPDSGLKAGEGPRKGWKKTLTNL